MLTEKLEHYQKLYKEYVLHMVEMHNNHVMFCKTPGFESGLHFRNSVRKIMKLEKALVRASQAAYKEHKLNLKNEKLLKREEKKNKVTQKKSKIAGVVDGVEINSK